VKKKYTRLTAFGAIIGIIFIILITRLAYIQIINGETFKNTAEAKGEKKIADLAPRGDILDRNNLKLATNFQSFNITYSNSNNNVKLKNDEINNELIETIKILNNNNDSGKLNTLGLPITVAGNKFSFTFSAKEEELRIKLANNLLKSANIDLPMLKYVFNNKTPQQITQINELNLAFRAKQIFYILAKKFGLNEVSQNLPIQKLKNQNKNSTNNKTIVINYNLRKDIDMDTIQKIIALRLAINNIGFSQYKTVYIANNVKRETFIAMKYKSNSLTKISCEVSPMRQYPNNEVGSAFLGYLGKIDENEADTFTNMGYDISRELVGKMGLEKYLENNMDADIKLRGEPGFQYVDVDKFGRILKKTAILDSIPGDTVVTTIDLNLQKVAEDSLNKTMHDLTTGITKSDANYTNANRGAAIVVDVRTGEVLALASRPGFDPNWFAATGSINDNQAKILFPTGSDPVDLLPKPMFNYATMGAGPPGSTFKPFVAISALQEKDITPSTIIVDRGRYTVVKGFTGACWDWNQYRRTHGPVDVAKALEVSCNYFFFETGRRLGYTNFQKWARVFGLASNPDTGKKPLTGIEIDEKPGEVSSPYRYKTANIDQIMNNQVVDYIKDLKYGGNIITKGTDEYKIIKDMFMTGNYDEKKLNNIGIVNSKALRHLKIQINQFNSQANSVGQLLNASIGQGQTLLTPLQMVSYISTLVNGGNRYKLHLIKKVLDPNGAVKKEIQPEILNKINLSPENVAAVKSGMQKVTEEGGTAAAAFRNYSIPTGGKTGSASVSEGQTKHGRAAYGWYLGFAPLNNPEIAVCVVIYDSGHGANVAPVARAIYDQYFGLNKPTTSPPGISIKPNNGNID
jgi:penicillin-binding protein 2